ncbi:PilW family protein [Oceanospirillum sp.]|uniref:PilW family protein n=1 Tax=Oceanospirillum sp. TaxID=2021254 RepID=UPI003A93D9FD
MNLHSLRRPGQAGFTLPELLISMVLGLSLVGAVMTVYLATVTSSMDRHKQVQLNHNLRTSMDLILSELRRAGGLAGGALPDSESAMQSLYSNNPFMDPVSNLRLWDCNAAYECRCVTYSYDLDGDNDPYTGDMNHFGFKLSSSKRLQIRTGTIVSYGGPHPGCDYNAALNTWESLTEDDVKITHFSISYTDRDGHILPAPEAIAIPSGHACTAGDSCLEARNLQVTISGSRDEFSMTVTGKVRVRNDRYIP